MSGNWGELPSYEYQSGNSDAYFAGTADRLTNDIKSTLPYCSMQGTQSPLSQVNLSQIANSESVATTIRSCVATHLRSTAHTYGAPDRETLNGVSVGVEPEIVHTNNLSLKVKYHGLVRGRWAPIEEDIYLGRIGDLTKR
ncbi:uncharacterized protein L203_102284 [Cryptococcus depauperatus CBS 7841]|uniref:Uncharacterized protein n=1 Tax=Cryptococcus depauperatus CBS 7841 TaxID=1295531 RepID=A0A1E3IA46_9TREE|nr:hypothetical protein L203_04739 [Cryptococcus depauperatus CBS 7841]